MHFPPCELRGFCIVRPNFHPNCNTITEYKKKKNVTIELDDKKHKYK